MLARYAVVVKNLRGVVLFDLGEEGSWRVIEWLTRKFRYRDLGLPPCIVDRFRSRLSSYLCGNPFRELVPPTGFANDFVDLVVSVSEFPREFVESIVYSSLYVSPLFVVGSRYSGFVDECSIGSVYVSRELSDRDWKLHLRIADYSITDMYLDCIEEACRALECMVSGDSGCVEDIIRGRVERVYKDMKRYWRIKSGEGTVFLSYIDLLKILYNSRDVVKEKISREYCICLSIIPAIHLRVRV